MLILKCTQKAAKEFGVKRADLPEIAAEDNSALLGDWFVNQIRFGRTKTLLFANARTLYSILVEYKKKDIAKLGQFFRIHLVLNLQFEGIAAEKIDRLLDEYQEITLAKSDSRSVLGSMNDLAWMYEAFIEGRGDIQMIDLRLAAAEINRTPQLKRDGHYSIDMLKEALEKI